MSTRFLAYRPGRDQPPISMLRSGTHPFRIVHESPWLIVWADCPEAVYRLPGDRGVVLGWAFAGRKAFDPSTLAPTNCTAGGLLNNIWGGYVAFLVDPVWGFTQALRDPSAIMPCLRVRAQGRDWLVSDMATAQAAGLSACGIDWCGVAWHLQATSLPLERTGLAGVRELLPGFTLTLDAPGDAASPVWSPWRHVGAAGDWTYQDAAAALSTAIDASVGTWAGAFDRIILDLSGGLDSSILAAVLSRSGSPFEALTFFTEGGDDERAYARPVAEHGDRCARGASPSRGGARADRRRARWRGPGLTPSGLDLAGAGSLRWAGSFRCC